MARIALSLSSASCWKLELFSWQWWLIRHCISGATWGDTWLQFSPGAIPPQQLTALTSSLKGHGCQQEVKGCLCTCTWGGNCQFRLRKVCLPAASEGRDFRWHFNSLLWRAIFRQCCCQSHQMLCVFWFFTELHNKRFSSLAHNGSVICWKSYYFEWPLIWRSIH